MKKVVLLRFACIALVLFGFQIDHQLVFAQATNPAAQSVPFEFKTQTGETLPAGVAMHRFGTSSATIPTSRTLAPGASDLGYASGNASGGWKDLADDGIGLLASSSQAAGAMVVAINTTGQSNIDVTWTCRTISQAATKDNSVALQYRVGTSGNFIDVGTTSTYESQQKAVGHSASFTETLPVGAENKGVVQVRWIYWQSANTGDSGRDRIAVDDIEITADSAPSISISASNTAASEPSTTTTATITFSDVTTETVTSFNYAIAGTATLGSDYSLSFASTPVAGVTPVLVTATSGTISVPAGVTSINVTLLPIDDLTSEGTETVTIELSSPPTGYLYGTKTATLNIVDDEMVPIHSVQGNGTTATPGTYKIQGIVTAVYPSLSPSGYYIQAATADYDADPETSEGIFVAQNSPTVLVGDLMELVGTVLESSAAPSYGQAVMTPTSATRLSSDNTLPEPVSLTLPVTSATSLERFEGMLVKYEGTLTVTNNEDLGAFGSVSLSQGGLVYQPTQILDPNDTDPNGTTSSGKSNASAITSLTNSNSFRTVVLDDGSAISPVTLPFVNGQNTLRVGSTVTNITGILGYAYSTYRLQPLASATPVFQHADRPSTPPAVGSGGLKVASFNVLNYFNGDGLGGGFPTERGAFSLAEFNRQRDKIISALTLINADVVGLIEIENDGIGDNSSVADLVNGLNTALGSDIYSYIDDAAVPNSDAIKCTIIYKKLVVKPVGDVMFSTNSIFERPPVAQNFKLISSDKNFVYIINHLKSKRCTSATGLNADQFDGQSCYNETRRSQATGLINFINTTVIPNAGNSRIISMGDYNAYFQEDPLDILRAGGYTVLGADVSYSYLFAGQVGSLDQAVVSPALAPAITGIGKWNINSLEPDYLSYKDAVDDGGSDVVNKWAATYTGNQWRSSDHDAVIVGIELSQALPVNLLSFTAKPEADKVKLNWSTTSETNNSFFTVQRSGNGKQFVDIASVDGGGNTSQLKEYSHTDSSPLEGTSYYRLKQTDFDGTSSLSRIVPVKFNADENMEFSVFPNPVTDHLNLQLLGLKKDGKIFNYEIVSDNGKKLYSGKGTLTEINKAADQVLPRIQTGLYILRAFDNSNSYVFKFMKQ